MTRALRASPAEDALQWTPQSPALAPLSLEGVLPKFCSPLAFAAASSPLVGDTVRFLCRLPWLAFLSEIGLDGLDMDSQEAPLSPVCPWPCRQAGGHRGRPWSRGHSVSLVPVVVTAPGLSDVTHSVSPRSQEAACFPLT